MDITKLITKCQASIDLHTDYVNIYQKVIEGINRHSATLAKIDEEITVYDNTAGLNFYPTDRKQALSIIKAFPGAWRKDYNQDTVNYSLTTEDGFYIRIAGAPLPPSCKVEWKEEVVPATTRRVAKITCKNPDEI